MVIQTKFNVGDLVWFVYSSMPNIESREVSIFDRDKEVGITVFRVTEHNVQTCYTTTQVFYDVRPMSVHYILKSEENTETKVKKTVKTFAGVSPSFGQDGKMTVRFREDELKFIDEDIKNDILSGLPQS